MKQQSLFRALAAVAVCTAALQAAPPAIDIPAETRATSEYVTIQPKTDATSMVYVGLSGVEAFPTALLKDSRTFLLPTRGLPKGRYTFAAVGTKGDEQTRKDFAVLVGDDPTPPPGPGPDPTPPPDALTQALQAAYLTETGVDRAASKTNLAALYRMAAETAQKAAITTWGQLFEAMGEAAASLGLKGKIIAVQKVIQTELKTSLPLDTTATLDEAGRAKAATVFARIASALEAVQ